MACTPEPVTAKGDLRMTARKQMRLKAISTFLVITTPLLPRAAVAQAVPKVGTCPSGYHTSGAACVPQLDAGPAPPRVGSCPSGYHTSGDYCLGSREARHAIPKTGACPSGYFTSGAYCLSSH